MTSFLSILAKSSGAIDQNLAVDKGNAGDVLISTTTGFSFVAQANTIQSANTIYITANTSSNNQYLTFASNTTSGFYNLENTSGIYCNPGSNIIYANSFSGNLTGTATNANLSVYSDNVFVTVSSGNQNLHVLGVLPTASGYYPIRADNQDHFTFNPNSNVVTITGNINLGGFLNGNVVGNLTGTASNATSATTATTATNIAGGSGGSIPYQSSANTTALLANGTAGQVLTSAGTTLAPTWSTAPQNTDGNWQFDDMWGGQNTNNGPFGMTQVGTPAVNSPQTQSAADGYNGIQRIWNTATNTSVGYESGGYLWFRNMLSNSKGFVMIFRPWPLGTATLTTLYVGFSNDFSASSPASQLAWQYSTNQAPTGQWSFRQDGANVYSSGYTTTGANQWHRMTLVRTGASTYTTTFQNLDVPSAIYSYSGTCSSTNLNLRMGGLVACISGAASKYLDIDYIGNYFNSAH